MASRSTGLAVMTFVDAEAAPRASPLRYGLNTQAKLRISPLEGFTPEAVTQFVFRVKDE